MPSHQHDMLHHAIMAISLSKYLIQESATGWPNEERYQIGLIASIIKQELHSLESAMDEHL